MTFEIFDKIMDKFLDKKCKNEMWLNEVERCLGPAWEPILAHNYEEDFIELLSLVMDDKGGWLAYFIYEKNCNWFEIEQDGDTIYIDSIEKLYHLISGEEF